MICESNSLQMKDIWHCFQLSLGVGVLQRSVQGHAVESFHCLRAWTACNHAGTNEFPVASGNSTAEYKGFCV